MIERIKKRSEVHHPGGPTATEERVVTTEREERDPMQAYESPHVTVIEVPMERGYAASYAAEDGGGW